MSLTKLRPFVLDAVDWHIGYQIVSHDFQNERLKKRLPQAQKRPFSNSIRRAESLFLADFDCLLLSWICHFEHGNFDTLSIDESIVWRLMIWTGVQWGIQVAKFKRISCHTTIWDLQLSFCDASHFLISPLWTAFTDTRYIFFRKKFTEGKRSGYRLQ